MRAFLTKNYRLILCCLLLWSFVTRIYRFDAPAGYVFDEVYHAMTAKLVLHNDPRAYEWWNPPPEPNTAVEWLHPPLAKYFQGGSMAIFGEDSFGWRFSSVLFGVWVVALTVLLADELFDDKPLALLAGFLASFDGLLLVQSRIAMNDIHVTFFILLSCFLYVHYRKYRSSQPFFLFLTALACGLAMASKWSGIFVLGLVGLFEFVRVISLARISRRMDFIKMLLLRAILLVALPPLVYVLSYSHMFLQGKSLICEGNEVVSGQCYCSQDSSIWVTELQRVWPNAAEYLRQHEARGGCARLVSHFSELHNQILWYQTTLKAHHPYESRPWQWFLDLRPVWYSVEYGDNNHVANIYAQGNPFLFWFGDIAIVGTGVAILYQTLKRRRARLFPALTFTLVAYLIVWVPWFASPRIMFFYHYTPAVPFLCILLGYWLTTLLRKHLIGKILAAAVLGLIIASFVLFYPNWTGISISQDWANAVYFALPSWK